MTLGGEATPLIGALILGPLASLGSNKSSGLLLWWKPFAPGDVATLTDLVATGAVKPSIDRRFPLSETSRRSSGWTTATPVARSSSTSRAGENATNQRAVSPSGTAVERLAAITSTTAGRRIRSRSSWPRGWRRRRGSARSPTPIATRSGRSSAGQADAEAVRDVRAELQVARLLLADRRFEVAFEAYGSGKTGPDLTVTFRAGRRFNVEVTRLRRVPDPAAVGAAVLAKLHQLPPSVPNAVVLAIDGMAADAVDIAAATQALRARADAKDEPWFSRRGFDGTRGFYERYLRLGAVFAWNELADGDATGRALDEPVRPDRPARARRARVPRLPPGP